MNHLGLFEGIGGFSLAARWMGWKTIAWCEWNEFGQKVLRHHFPEAEGHGDITKTDFTKYHGAIDIISGGFPCQPYSSAGKRLGKEDDRHLWPEMLRVIREVQPTWVVGENVFGLVNWSGGLVFDEVQSDLEAQGYEVQPYVLPAVSVNAPHRRDRVWFVAKNTKRNGCIQREFKQEGAEIWEQRNIGSRSSNRIHLSERDASNTSNEQLQGSKFNGGFRSEGKVETNGRQFSRPICSKWEVFPTQSPICNGDDGLSSRLDSITFPKWRAESIKAGGNAIVPQVAYQIFKSIEEYEKRF
jgi:DNA (cytosine-5)-methyltransferase 1